MEYSENMQLLEFFASVIESLAWPLVTGYCVYILRIPLGKLLERVSKLKYGELEAEFQERLSRIEPITNDTALIKQEEHSSKVALEDLPEISPRAAVLEAWIIVERAASEFCMAHGLPLTLSYQGLFQLAKKNDLDIDAFQTAFQELRILRNKAVHASDTDITSATAKQYVKTANLVAAELSMRARPA